MRLHSPLNNILNNEIKVKILRLFCRTNGEWSGRRIAREISVSPAACHKALSELQKEGILRLRNIGKTYLYSLEQTNLIVKNLLKPLYKKEENLPLALANVLKELPLSLRRRVISLAIFGSISKKKERAFSDIDLLVVVKDKKDEKLLDANLERLNFKVMRQYGNTLSPYIQTEEGFRLKFKRRLPLIRNIIQNHILIFGKSLTSILYERKKRLKPSP